eukprot:scaffold62436_cov59-Attheya_sp.AAC.2
MDKVFEQQAKVQLQNLPDFIQPKEFKKNFQILEHQKDALCWLANQERDPRPNPFFYKKTLLDGSTAMYDRISKRRLTQPHAAAKGSILADGVYAHAIE